MINEITITINWLLRCNANPKDVALWRERFGDSATIGETIKWLHETDNEELEAWLLHQAPEITEDALAAGANPCAREHEALYSAIIDNQVKIVRLLLNSNMNVCPCIHEKTWEWMKQRCSAEIIEMVDRALKEKEIMTLWFELGEEVAEHFGRTVKMTLECEIPYPIQSEEPLYLVHAKLHKEPEDSICLTSRGKTFSGAIRGLLEEFDSYREKYNDCSKD